MPYLMSAILGAVVGLISAKTFFAHSWTALLPWGLIGLVVGYPAKTKKIVVMSGAIYGFILPVVFTLTGYQGSGPWKPAFFLLALVLGIVGAGCGIALALIGQKFHHQPSAVQHN